MLVKLTGFGNSAGFLVERGLMGMGGLASQGSTTRADIEAMTGKPLPKSAAGPQGGDSSNQHSGAGASNVEVEEEGEFDEEEERKAKELMERLEDMERRGLVKLVRKGEPMPEGVSALPPRSKKDDEPPSQ